MSGLGKKKRLSIGGTEVAYWVYGNSSLPSIVMVHGFRGTHNGLELITKNLSNDFNVIVPDLPGFGDSDEFSNKPHNLESYTAFLQEFINQTNGSRPVHLLGHSFGSIIVSSFAAKFPEKITKLVLVNPIGAPALEGPRAILSKLALLYYRTGGVLPGKIGQAWLAAKPVVWIMSKAMTKTKDKELVRYIDTQHYTHFSRFKSKKSVLEAFETSIKHSVREFAPRINLPVLMVVGNQDDITPLNKQFELVKLFPSARMEIIKDVGHLVHYETPKQTAVHIRKFIN